MNETIIFCGAGYHAEECVDRWLNEGLNAVCFAEIDKNKFYKTLGGLKILPLKKALKKYPDYVLYLTQGYENLLPVTEDLITRGIPRERIKYADSYEWRKGCSMMGKHIGFTHNSWHFCCDIDNRQSISRTDSLATDVIRYRKYVDNVINDLRQGRPTPCDNCNALREGIWDKTPKLWRVGVTPYFAQTSCNFKCVYCFAKGKMTKETDKTETPLDLLKGLYEIVKHENLVVGLAAGETTVNPWGDELLEFLLQNRWHTEIATNASVYNDKISTMLQNGIAEVLISLDAGTRETFAKIKGVDCWDMVMENTKKYAQAGGKIKLKYLVSEGINDNETDMDGFINLCHNLNADALLHSDRIGIKALTPNMLAVCIHFARRVSEKGIKSLIFYEDFIASDRVVIEKEMQKKKVSIENHIKREENLCGHWLNRLKSRLFK